MRCSAPAPLWLGRGRIDRASCGSAEHGRGWSIEPFGSGVGDGHAIDEPSLSDRSRSAPTPAAPMIPSVFEEDRMRRSLAVVAGILLLASVATAASAKVTPQVRPRAGRAEN